MAGIDDLSDMHIVINPNMDKILRDYPHNSLPTKLNRRTGKAKKCLYEEIDPNLYEKDARMVTFYTTLNRIHPWIKTLDVFYYDHLGSHDNFDIKWYDEPKSWTDPNNNGNSIIIEVLNKDEELQYNVTFFVTTGTIRVQGSKYMTFANSHFPKLKEILVKVLDSVPSVTVDENQNDLDETMIQHNLNSQNFGEEYDQEDNSITSVKSTFQEEPISHDIPYATEVLDNIVGQFACLENTVTNAFLQMETKQAENTSKLMTAISSSCETMSNLFRVGNKDKISQEIPSLQRSILSLKEKNELLETQLKICEGKVQLERSQHDESTKSLQTMLDETRAQLKQTLETLTSEASIHTDKMKTKNEELEKLSQLHA